MVFLFCQLFCLSFYWKIMAMVLIIRRWMGEKYDGIRVCWHPFLRSLYTRSGLPLDFPAFLAACFPEKFVDGEFWYVHNCILVFTNSELKMNWRVLSSIPK